jgi:tripartite-type tricarboxylate transporter receptor subunit TctC
MFVGAPASKRRRILLKVIAAAAIPAMRPVWAQGAGVTRLIVPFTPGASNDVIGRMMAEAVAKRTGKTWIVENKPGAGSMIGAEFVARSAPDGNTLLLCGSANMGTLPAVHKSLRYAVERDFAFLVRIANSPFALAVNSQLPATNFGEFVRLAKSKPKSIRTGSTGIGALDYMGASLLQSQLAIELNVVPYKGMAPVLSDLRAGHIDASIVSPATVRPLALEGKVRVLAVFDKRRSELMPEVPSSTDLGHPGLVVGNWWGIAGPKKTPAQVTTSLQQAMTEVLSDPAFLEALKAKGFDAAPLAGAEFERFVLAELNAWRTVAKNANITLD